MAFAASGLVVMVPSIGAGPALYRYTSTDGHATVEATDYFAAMETYGMRVGDVVIVIDSDAPAVTIHTVTAVDSDGNATISAATLA
jgi:hypothetical protein